MLSSVTEAIGNTPIVESVEIHREHEWQDLSKTGLSQPGFF